MSSDVPAVDPLDEVRVTNDPADPDAVLMWLPEFTCLDMVAWSVEIGVPRALLPDLRSALEAVDVPAGESAPRVRATRFEVSLLPEDDVNYRSFRVLVEERDGYGWTVHDGHACLSAAGVWDGVGISVYGNDEAWIVAHRFDRETALRLAREAAPGVTVNGVTAAEVLRRREAA